MNKVRLPFSLQRLGDAGRVHSLLAGCEQAEVLRYNPHLVICTCRGATVSKEHHLGVLRNLDGFMEYNGE